MCHCCSSCTILYLLFLPSYQLPEPVQDPSWWRGGSGNKGGDAGWWQMLVAAIRDARPEEQESHLPGPLASVKTLHVKDWFLWKEEKRWNCIKSPKYWPWKCAAFHAFIVYVCESQHEPKPLLYMSWLLISQDDPTDTGNNILSSTAALAFTSDWRVFDENQEAQGPNIYLILTNSII